MTTHVPRTRTSTDLDASARRGGTGRNLAVLVGALAVTTSALLAACGDDQAPFEPDIDMNAIAGMLQEEVSYTVPGTGEARTLPVYIWYPTTDTEGTTANFNLISRDPNSLVDATLDAPSGPLPVMVWSHGGLGWGGQANGVLRQFVRNGWIVVALTHSGDTLFDRVDPLPPEFDIVRAHDVNTVIEYIADLPAGHRLEGHLMTDRFFLVGHSVGGESMWLHSGVTLDQSAIAAGCPDCTQGQLDAFALFTSNPRVAAVAPLAGELSRGVLVSEPGFATTRVPVLFMSGSNNWDGEPLFTLAAATPDLTWVELQGGCHESFTGTLPCDTLDNAESLPAVARLLLSFGEVHIRESNDANALGMADGTVPIADFMTFRGRP